MKIKGLIFSDMCGYRGYGKYMIEYFKSQCDNFLGSLCNINQFDIKNNKLYYNNNVIIIDNFSHIMFLYKCDELYKNNSTNMKLSDIFNKMFIIEEWIKNNTNIIIINKLSNSKYDTYRDKFFYKLKNIVNIPDFKIIKNIDDINSLINNMDDNNYLLRSNSDCDSFNCFFINKDNIQKYYNYLKDNINSDIIAVKFYSPYVEELDCNITARIYMNRDNYSTILVEPFAKNLFTYRQKDPDHPFIETLEKNNRVSTAKLEHLKILNPKNIKEFHTKCYLYIIDYVDKYIKHFQKMQRHIGLDTISVDFLPLKTGPLFLEIGIKSGLSGHKFPVIIDNTNPIISQKYIKYRDDHNHRNEIIYKNLFKKYNLYCDIDFTVCNSLPRIKKWTLPKWPGTSLDIKWQDETEMLNDTVLDNASHYLNLLSIKYNIIFITSRKYIKNAENITIKWLDKFKFIYDKIILTDSLENKIQYLEKDCDLFVDDFSKGHHTNTTYIQDKVVELCTKKGIIFEIYNSKINNWENIYNKYKN